MENEERFEPSLMPGAIIGEQNDFSKWRLEASSIIVNIEHHIQGESYDESVKKWTRNNEAVIMNSIGAKSVISTLETIVNKVSILSNITDEEIEKLCVYTHLGLARKVYDNWDIYGVQKNPSPIINEVMSLIFLCLKRAQGEGERKAIRENVSRTYIESSPESKRSFISSLNPFGGKSKEH
jgi:hypothetical protein